MSRDIPQYLTDHLEEFRRRFIICFVCFVLFSGAAYFFVDPVLNWLAKPIGDFIFTAPTEALMIRLKISFGLGLVASFPLILFQFWKFVEVALRGKERSFLIGVIPMACILFYVGMTLAVVGVAPRAVFFLIQFGSPHLRPFISIDAYLSFLLWMILGFGLLFQLPLVIAGLVQAGVVKVATLSTYRKQAIVIIFIVAAFLTPGPDMFSQLLLALPTYLLFEISLLFARRLEK